MKKLVLFLIAVSILGMTNAQKVTKIYGKWSLGDTLTDLNGSEWNRQLPNSLIANFRLYLFYEFTNGNNALTTGDSVIIEGKFSEEGIENRDDTVRIDDVLYKGLRFVLQEDLAAGSSTIFNIEGSRSVSTNGVTGANPSWEIGVRAKCIYTSQDGDLKTPATPDVSVKFHVNNTTAVAESALAEVKIVPTFVTEDLQISNLQNTDVAIYSLVGQQMATYKNLTGNVSLDVSSFVNGIYFVKMQSGNAIRTEKIKIVR